jgi:membrane-associated phospholipid phosphatase
LAKGAKQANFQFDALLPIPDSPSYPSEHSAVAAAAAAVLAALYPAEAAKFRAMAEEAGQSRVNAGLQYPSDHEAGAELGQKIGLAILARSSSDGSATPFSTPVPTGKCNWVGTNPGNAAAIYWRPVLLISAAEFRPPVPPECDSPQMVQQTADVKNTPRALTNFATNERAFYWQSVEGRDLWGYRYANQWMAEDHLDRNPPRAARAYALLAGAFYDSFIASQDGKVFYWYIRPSQLDPSIVPLFTVPNFPSYPSNHSALTTARGEILAYLFPSHAAQARAMAKESGDSRIWAGIHYQIDNEAGVELGKKVAGKFIEWASGDGSQ